MAPQKNTAKTPDLKSKDAGAKTRAATRHEAAPAPAKTVTKAPASQHSAKDKEPVLVEVVDHAAAEAERHLEREEQARIDAVENPPKVTAGPDSELQVHTTDPALQHVQGGVDDAAALGLAAGKGRDEALEHGIANRVTTTTGPTASN